MNQRQSTGGAYLLLAFLTLLNVLNFIDRQLIPSLGPILMQDLGMSRAEIGLLYGYVFIVFYTVIGMVLGNIADRFHRPRLIAGGLGLWSALTAVSGAAMNFLHLALARMFVGVGEATLTPAAVSMLGDVFPPKRRAMASGVYYAGVPLGAGLGLIISGWMVPHYGWRSCFYVLGLLGLVFVPIIFLVKNPPRGLSEEMAVALTATPTDKPSMAEIYRSLFQALRRAPTLPLAVLSGVLANFGLSAANMVQTWLTTERGFDYQTAAYVNGGLFTIAGMIGTIGGGWVSDWFQRRWPGGRMWFLVIQGILFLPFTLGFLTLSVEAPFYLFYVCWFLSSVGSTSWYGPVFATVQELAPARIRSTAIAFLLLALNLLGTGAGPLIAGMIGDATSLWRGLIICACIGYSFVIPAFFAGRRYRTDLAWAQPDRVDSVVPSPA